MLCAVARFHHIFDIGPQAEGIKLNQIFFLLFSYTLYYATILLEMKEEKRDLAEIIYAAVRQIPRGKVASYSQIAALAGNCNLRRYVGNALHKNPSNAVTPCHRVVNAKGFCSGSFAFGGPDAQRSKLEAEGVCFVDGHVDLEHNLVSEDDFEAMKAGLAEDLQRGF